MFIDYEIIILVLLGFYWFYFGQLKALFTWYKHVGKTAKRYGVDWQKTAPTSAKIGVILFVLFDWWVNYTTVTLRFAEIPNSWSELVTTRMKTWRKRYEGKKPSELSLNNWHKRLYAVSLCDQLLDGHDPKGDHC